jgi:2-polyprenyl-3-methyl-5-hydroxy-6-metoxy-1,4-benzoquinol methylase
MRAPRLLGKAAVMSTQPRDMDERTWWDFWNGSYRAQEQLDATCSELFQHAATVVNDFTRHGTARVLEIACGTGALARQLVYASYHGLDLSPGAIEVARQKAEETQSPREGSLPSFEAADFHEWPLPPEPFDVVLCVDAISAFRDQALVMRKMKEALHPRGKLVLTTVNPFVYNRIRRSAAQPLETGPVSRWLSRGELHALVTSAGLTIERSYTIMPRGNLGILRLLNARRLNQAFGPRVAAVLRRLKEEAGIGQYRVLVAHKN